jgi:hypothetical protein
VNAKRSACPVIAHSRAPGGITTGRTARRHQPHRGRGHWCPLGGSSLRRQLGSRPILRHSARLSSALLTSRTSQRAVQPDGVSICCRIDPFCDRRRSAPQWAPPASRTRVRNQRRTSTAVLRVVRPWQGQRGRRPCFESLPSCASTATGRPSRSSGARGGRPALEQLLDLLCRNLVTFRFQVRPTNDCGAELNVLVGVGEKGLVLGEHLGRAQAVRVHRGQSAMSSCRKAGAGPAVPGRGGRARRG